MALDLQTASRVIYSDRLQAAKLLSKKLTHFRGRDPLILAIPRGGVVLGAVLADETMGELDVVIVRKLRCPWNQELAIGAIVESGINYLTPLGEKIKKDHPDYLESEIHYQSGVIAERSAQIRKVKSQAQWEGRTIILTDDGIATGATFMGALRLINSKKPQELIAAIPVLPQERIKDVRQECNQLVYLQAPSDFEAVGQFYTSFPTVDMNEVIEKLRSCENRLKEKRLC